MMHAHARKHIHTHTHTLNIIGEYEFSTLSLVKRISVWEGIGLSRLLPHKVFVCEL